MKLSNVQKIKSENFYSVFLFKSEFESGAEFFVIVKLSALDGEKIRSSKNNKEIAKIVSNGAILHKGFGHKVPSDLIEKYNLNQSEINLVELLEKKKIEKSGN